MPKVDLLQPDHFLACNALVFIDGATLKTEAQQGLQ